MAADLTTRRRRKLGSEQPAIAVPLFVATYGCAAAVMSVLVVMRLHTVATHHFFPWPLIAGAILVAQFTPLRLHTEGQPFVLMLVGVPIIVGTILVSPLELVISIVVAMTAGAVLMHDSIQRGVFNVANLTIGGCVARWIMAGYSGTHAPTGTHGVVALCLASLGLEVSTFGGLLIVVSLSGGLPRPSYLRNMGLNLALAVAVDSVFAVITVTIALVEIWGIAFLVGPGLVLALWYRTASVARERYANLEDIYGFTVKLAALAETEDVVAVALAEARSMIRCRYVSLRLPLGRDGIRFQLDESGELQQTFTEPTSLEGRIADGHDPVLVGRGRRDRMPAGYDCRDLMAAPVRLGDAGTAVMVVGDHTVDSETFDAEDLRFFEALAANLGTALTSSQRLDRLRAEVAAREHEALHDSLTGLANRTLFGQWVVDALAHRRAHQQVAVMVMDLDGFKDINDTLGHHTGDSILKEVGGRVLAAVGADRMASRLGGDEFAFVIPAAEDAEEAMDIASAIVESVARPVAIDGLVLELRASIGLALAPKHGTDAATLLRRADVAMYAAKTGKRGIVAYNQEIDQNTTRRLILATELRRAMEARDLQVWYQPIANLDTGAIAGLEALLRWNHSHHGAISPNEFIPVAEQSGLIEPLTWWVMETALKELARWRADGYDLGMAVNFSARSLLGPEIVDRLGRLLSDFGTPPSDLTLEITESLMMTDPDGSERILSELSELGVKIAIDDFGTGYSSLSRLKRLPVQTVKIDQSFVLNMHRDEGDEAIVRATIELARNMGHSVIAEGVEERTTWERLGEMGCDQAQGHLLAAAMPADELRKWLKGRQAPALAPIRLLPSATRKGA